MNSDGFGKLAKNKMQYDVYVDIFFTSDPVLSPYYIHGWDKVETIRIPKCLYEVLDITKCPPKDQRDYSRALKIQNNIIDKMLLFVENNISK